ncbi:MAG: hypothetical protein GX559_02005 [Candidatus Pacebacteria bacterium]|nr:hypothetical protein [Candidatus Paceibacterota bacterium]
MIIKNKKNKKPLHSKNWLKNIAPFLIIVLIFLVFSQSTFFKIRILKQNLFFTPSNNFSDEEIQLEIISPIKNAQIFYTLDGSTPTPQSHLYESAKGLLVKNNTIIKAALFKNNKQLSSVVHKNYFINFSSDLPILAINTNPPNLWDNEIGIYVVGNDPNIANFTKQDDSWKRPAHLSYFENNQEIFSRSINIKISGGSSAYFPQKSFNLYFADSEPNNQINYQIFPDRERKIFDSLKISNSGNDWYSTLFRDCLMQELLLNNTDLSTQACRPAVVFLNGDYWGIYNVRERYNRDYFVQNYADYKLESKNIIVSVTHNYLDKKGLPKIKIGKEKDGDSYTELINFVRNNYLIITSNYQKVINKIDVNNFIDYNIAEMFYANYDWPHANYKFWRYKNNIFEETLSPLDGRWRWLIYDTDYGFALDGPKNMNHLVKDDALSLDMFYKLDREEYVFKNLFDNPDFRNKFVSRYFDLLNSAFKEETVIKKIEELSARIDQEIIRHIARWGDQTEGMLTSKEAWYQNIEKLKNFASNRPAYVKNHLIQYFELAGLYEIKINTQGPCVAEVKVNSLTLDANHFPWLGDYPLNKPLALEGLSSKTCNFVSWLSDDLNPESLRKKNLLINPTKNLEITAVFAER